MQKEKAAEQSAAFVHDKPLNRAGSPENGVLAKIRESHSQKKFFTIHSDCKGGYKVKT